MENAQIDNGDKKFTINGDEARVIIFNPTDTFFAEKFYILTGEMQETLNTYRVRAEEMERDKTKDKNGLTLNILEQIKLQRELCDILREKIDDVFGAGTSQTAFGNTRNLDVFKQFFDAITPFFQTARVEKIAQYTTPASAKRNKRKG